MQTSSFYTKCKGIALVAFSFAAILFGSAALIATINPAKADNPTTVNESGKIMIHQESSQKDGKSYYNVLVWDTETGKSKMYYLGSEGYKTASHQLPSSPLY